MGYERFRFQHIANFQTIHLSTNQKKCKIFRRPYDIFGKNIGRSLHGFVPRNDNFIKNVFVIANEARQSQVFVISPGLANGPA